MNVRRRTGALTPITSGTVLAIAPGGTDPGAAGVQGA